MALGEVRIVDNRQHWWDADIQVLALNSRIPHASIGGIEEDSNRRETGSSWVHIGVARPGSTRTACGVQKMAFAPSSMS